MNKAHLISVSTALALGYAGGFAADGMVAKAAINAPRPEIVNVTLGPTAQVNLEAFVDAKLCPAVDTKLELAGPDACSAARDARRICMTWAKDSEGVTRVKVSAALESAGTWTPGAAQ